MKMLIIVKSDYEIETICLELSNYFQERKPLQNFPFSQSRLFSNSTGNSTF